MSLSVERRPYVLALRLTTGPFDQFVVLISAWASDPEPKARFIVCADVSLCMKAVRSEPYRTVLEEADLISPDGMPLVWALRKLGFPGQERVCGPDLMLALCAEAAVRGLKIGLYGAEEKVLSALKQRLEMASPGLQIVYCHAPPYRPLTAEEDQAVCSEILASGAQLLFVGIGHPKQEIWIAEHKDRLPVTMLGVGAAFLFHSGFVKRAPVWMRKVGLEWLYRLLSEPRRLFSRYLSSIVGFLWHTACLSRWGLERQQRRFRALSEARCHRMS